MYHLHVVLCMCSMCSIYVNIYTQICIYICLSIWNLEGQILGSKFSHPGIYISKAVRSHVSGCLGFSSTPRTPETSWKPLPQCCSGQSRSVVKIFWIFIFYEVVFILPLFLMDVACVLVSIWICSLHDIRGLEYLHWVCVLFLAFTWT